MDINHIIQLKDTIKNIALKLYSDLLINYPNNLDLNNEDKEDIVFFNNFKNIASCIQTSIGIIEDNSHNIPLCNKEHNKIIMNFKNISDDKILDKIKTIVPEQDWNLITV